MEPKVDKTTCCLSIQCKWSQKLRNQNKQYLFQKSILSNKHKKPVLFVWIFIWFFAIFFVSLFLIVVMHQTQTPQKQSFIHRICSILSFACFCDACLISDKTSTATTTRDNSRATTNHFSLRKYGLKKFHQIFHLKIFVVFFVCINKIMRNFRHNHMTQRDVLKTIGAKENWWQRLFLAKKHKNCWKRFTSFLSDVGLSYQPNYAHDQDYFEVTSDFDELAKDDTNLVLVVSLLRFQDNKTLQRFESDFQISARTVSCSMWLKSQVKFCGSNHFILSQKLRSVFVWCLQILINSHNFVSCKFVIRKLLMFIVLDLFLILIWVVVNELRMWVEWEMFTNWICLVVVELVIFQNWLGLFLVWFDELTEFFLDLMLMLSGLDLSKFFFVFLWLFQMCFFVFGFLFFVLDLSVQNTTNSFFKNRFNSVFFIDQWKEKEHKKFIDQKKTQLSPFSIDEWRSHTKSERKYIWIKQMQIGEIREKQGAALCSFSLSYLFWFWELWQKKKQDVMIVFGHKNKFRTQIELKKQDFFVFFVCHLICLACYFMSKQQPLNHPKNHFLCLFWVFCHILQLLSWLFVFCCLRHQNQKKKKKTQKSHDDTHWLAFLIFLLLPQKLSQKNEFNRCYFSVKGKDVVFGVFHFIINKAPKHTISSVNGLWKVPLQSFVSLSETWNRIFVTMKTNLFDATWPLSMLPLVEPKLWRYSLKVVNVKSWNSSIVWSRNAQDPTNLWVCHKSVSFLSFCFTMRVFSQSVFWLLNCHKNLISTCGTVFSDYLLKWPFVFFFFFVRMCWLVNPRIIPSTMSFWRLANFFCKLSQQNKKSDIKKVFCCFSWLAFAASHSKMSEKIMQWVFLEICQTFNNKFVLFFLVVSSTTKEKPNNNWTKQKTQSWKYVQEKKRIENKNKWKQKRIENKNNDSNHNSLSIFVTISAVMDFAEIFHLFFLSRICSQTQHSSQTKQQQAQP